jgi:4-amino-4-deoxy-L-arabinose transferase-like glycosyltransferase
VTASRAALLYVLVLSLLWALIPTLTFPNPPLDVVEGFAWGRELALGYTKHPPMQAWLLEMTYRLTGGGTFGGYWLSQISIALGYWCIWQLAQRLGLTDWQAFWSLVLTSVTFYFTLPAPEFNPNILQIPVWAAMILLFHRALSGGRLSDWILLGAIAAFGLYSKYFVALLIGAIGLYVLVRPEARKTLATPGPWLATVVCVALLIPHILWLLDTDFLTLQYAASRSKGAANWTSHIVNPLTFLGAQIGDHAGLFIVLLVGFGLSEIKSLPATLKQSNTAPHVPAFFLLWFAFLPLGVVLLASTLTGNEFEHMWGTPLFVLSGITATVFLKIPGTWTAPRRAMITALLIQALFLGITTGQALLEPLWKTKRTRLHYPGQAIAQTLSREWGAATGTSLAYVAGDMWSAANVTLHAPERPSMFYQHDLRLSPWINFEDVQKKGVLLVWRGNSDTPPDELARYYPNVHRDGSRAFQAYSYGTLPPIEFNWAIVPPGAVVREPAK